MSALIFLDTETTGLDYFDDIWEVAAIRRELDGTETEHHWMLPHDEARCAELPEPFFSDHFDRFPHDDETFPKVAPLTTFAEEFAELTADKPHVVGAVPNFDTERLERLLVRVGEKATWHYHLLDVENLAIGYLGAKRAEIGYPDLSPPWESEALSRSVGVDPDKFERHTAMGDAKWARAIYDRVIRGGDS